MMLSLFLAWLVLCGFFFTLTILAFALTGSDYNWNYYKENSFFGVITDVLFYFGGIVWILIIIGLTLKFAINHPL